MLKSEGTWSLKRSYSYYYQVQLQLHACHDALYANFIVNTKTEIVVECIYRDDQFLRTVLTMQGIFSHRMLVAEKDGTIPIPATADTSDSKIDDDDIGRCWLLTI